MRIEFTYGLMGSGKTRKVILNHRLYDVDFSLLMSHYHNNRDEDKYVLVSRIGEVEYADLFFSEEGEFEVCTYDAEDWLQHRTGSDDLAPVLVVDESQFLSCEEVDKIISWAKKCDFRCVRFVGLLEDFLGRQFESSTKLLREANFVNKMNVECWCGENAHYNARYVNREVLREGAQIEYGWDDKYVVLCSKHYVEGDIGPDKKGV